MARAFLFMALLKEAQDLDNLEMRRQAYEVRNLRLLTRDSDYVKAYRLSEELIEKLQLEVEPFMKKSQFPNLAISNRVKILCTLSFLASGSYQQEIKNDIRSFVSQPSASRCIMEVVDALNNPEIVRKYIRFPQNKQERNLLKERFFKKFKIPSVIGCIDGTLVALKRPSVNEERFYCRKGYHARNVQLITDADLNILHVDPTYGGATHDSFIFNYSLFKDHLETLVNIGEDVCLLGDSGYAQRAFLMTPIGNAEESTPEAHYNSMHATARNTVERTIGVLKGRFRCLLVHRVLDYHPDKVAKIVIACCVLHNLCNRCGMPAFNMTEEEKNDELEEIMAVQRRQRRDVPPQTDLALGQLRRQELVNLLWRSRFV